MQQALRILAHLLSVVLLLPSLVFACGLLIFEHVLASTSLFEFLIRLLFEATGMAALAFFVLVVVVLSLLIAGIFDRARWMAGLCVAILVMASMLALFWISGVPDTADGWSFFVPGIVSFAISAWLATTRSKSLA